jgi:hypothetical protein
MHELAFILQNQFDPDAARRVATMILAAIPLIILIVILLLMIPFWFICKKAGFSPWLSLLCIIPSLGTLVLLYILAFAEWKVAPVQQLGWAPQPPIPPPYPPQPPLPPQV